MLSSGQFVFDTITVYEEYYWYDEISFLAETGGFVGIFLGQSIREVVVLLFKLVTALVAKGLLMAVSFVAVSAFCNNLLFLHH